MVHDALDKNLVVANDRSDRRVLRPVCFPSASRAENARELEVRQTVWYVDFPDLRIKEKAGFN